MKSILFNEGGTALLDRLPNYVGSFTDLCNMPWDQIGEHCIIVPPSELVRPSLEIRLALQREAHNTTGYRLGDLMIRTEEDL